MRPAQGFNLVFQRAVLEFLRRVDEPVEIAEDRRQLRVAKASPNAVGIGGAAVPIVPALEPPGLAPVSLENIARMRQAPDAEFRADQRFAARLHGIAVGRPRPIRAGRELPRRLGERFVLRRKCIIPMKVLDIGLHVIVAGKTGRVVDDEAMGRHRLGEVEGLDQPVAIIRVVVEIDAPPLVEQRPDADRGMMAVRGDGFAENVAQVRARGGREELHIRHVEPDDQAEPIGEVEIVLVGDFDVASQRVEAHRLGVAEPLLEESLGRMTAILLRMQSWSSAPNM
jgi:hypothetical protein